MINLIKFSSLYQSDLGWLRARFHFSFAEYQNPENMNFGVLRVMNDDLINPHQGFGMHPHQDMEIVSYVIKGELTHQDNLGNQGALGPGEVQYMSAGTGVVHSEFNETDQQTRLLQIWIPPTQRGLPPAYGSKSFGLEDRLNRWLHFVGPQGATTPITIHQDANFFVTQLDPEQSIDFPLASGRQAYVKLIEGEANLNNVTLTQGDAAEIRDEEISIQTEAGAHVLIIEMPRF